MVRGFTLIEIMIVIAVIAVASMAVWGLIVPMQQQIDDRRLQRDVLLLRDSLREQIREQPDTTEWTVADRLITRGLAPRSMIRWENRTLWTPWTDPVQVVQELPPGDPSAILAETLAIDVSMASLSTESRRGLCERLARALRPEFLALRVGATPIRSLSPNARDASAADEDLQLQAACANATTMRMWL